MNSTDRLMTVHSQVNAPINYFKLPMKVTHLSVTANSFINVPNKLFGSNSNSWDAHVHTKTNKQNKINSLILKIHLIFITVFDTTEPSSRIKQLRIIVQELSRCLVALR